MKNPFAFVLPVLVGTTVAVDCFAFLLEPRSVIDGNRDFLVDDGSDPDPAFALCFVFIRFHMKNPATLMSTRHPTPSITKPNITRPPVDLLLVSSSFLFCAACSSAVNGFGGIFVLHGFHIVQKKYAHTHPHTGAYMGPTMTAVPPPPPPLPPTILLFLLCFLIVICNAKNVVHIRC